jgi:ADP-ribosylglycohydrolase
MGVPYEFRDPAQIGEVRWGERGTHGKPPGTWSDDGALMLALLDSVLGVGFDPEDQGRRALDWRRNGAYTPDGDVFDIGGTTSSALQAIEGGTPAEDAGPTHEQSASNGSLMRILPIALWASASSMPVDDLIDLSMRASRVTHGHPAAQVACAVYTLLAARLLEGGKADYLEHGYNPVRSRLESDQGSADRMGYAELQRLHSWREEHQPEGRGGAFNAFWSAWLARACVVQLRLPSRSHRPGLRHCPSSVPKSHAPSAGGGSSPGSRDR